MNNARLISADNSSNGSFNEKDLIELAATLGLSYEIEYNAPVWYSENKSYIVQAWVKFKGLKSKRYAVFITGKNSHTKRFPLEAALIYRKAFRGKEDLLPKDVKCIRDEAASYVVKNILRGCIIKVSETRHIMVQPSSSIEELKLKMAVAGGNA